jgi:hypothetical protein
MNLIKEGIYLGDIRAAEDQELLRHFKITHMLSIGYFPHSCPAYIK